MINNDKDVINNGTTVISNDKLVIGRPVRVIISNNLLPHMLLYVAK